MPRALLLGPVVGVAGNALLWWSVVSPELAPGRYVWALLLYLAIAGISFITAVFHDRKSDG